MLNDSVSTLDHAAGAAIKLIDDLYAHPLSRRADTHTVIMLFMTDIRL